MSKETLYARVELDSGQAWLHDAYGSSVLKTEVLVNRKNKLRADIIPPVLRAFNADMSCVMFERPPFVAPVRYRIRTGKDSHLYNFIMEYSRDYCIDEAKGIFKFNIPIPWTVYLIDYRNYLLYLACRPEQIYSEQDTLYALPLPNVGSFSGETCVSETVFNQHYDSLAEMIPSFANIYWSTVFNSDLSAWWDDAPLVLKEPTEHASQELILKTEYFSDLAAVYLLTNYSRLSMEESLSLDYTELQFHYVQDGVDFYRPRVVSDWLDQIDAGSRNATFNDLFIAPFC